MKGYIFLYYWFFESPDEWRINSFCFSGWPEMGWWRDPWASWGVVFSVLFSYKEAAQSVWELYSGFALEATLKYNILSTLLINLIGMAFKKGGSRLVLQHPHSERGNSRVVWRTPFPRTWRKWAKHLWHKPVIQEGTGKDYHKFPSLGRWKHKNKVTCPHNEERNLWKREEKNSQI